MVTKGSLDRAHHLYCPVSVLPPEPALFPHTNPVLTCARATGGEGPLDEARVHGVERGNILRRVVGVLKQDGMEVAVASVPEDWADNARCVDIACSGFHNLGEM
eukprot:scaffold21262_cov30-Tisochrysis_lutea.AAC.3